MAEKVVITVLGKDRVGIVAEISGVLYQNNVNILDINQKILGEEIFAMTMLVDISLCKVSFAELKEQLGNKGEEIGLKIVAQHEDIFKFMHRI
ncbi:MAG: ACT domain-containing protein [Deltaproteobacteria bacterium]|nr:ACT domain-containing protein [Deltaproteobacteria bacterium]